MTENPAREAVVTKTTASLVLFRDRALYAIDARGLKD